ncbi:MAG: ribbon-helix-helix domain-containing protein [Dongiaceae bacterium]
MCRIFSGQDPDLYKAVTRSVRLNGYCTSIRLEALFWSILDEIAAREKMTTPRFISTLYDEVLERRDAVGNFASLLRVTCAVHMSGAPLPRADLPEMAGRDASSRVAAPA